MFISYGIDVTDKADSKMTYNGEVFYTNYYIENLGLVKFEYIREILTI